MQEKDTIINDNSESGVGGAINNNLIPETQKLPEPVKEPTEEEKRNNLIQSIVNSKLHYKPKKQFGVAYKKERNRKNKEQKKSRKSNR